LNGAKWWQPPVKLEAGDAIWIKEGWWHSVGSQAGGVAVPIEITSGPILCKNTPCVFRHVGPGHVVGGRNSGHLVSRRVGWASAAAVLEMWRPALAVFHYKGVLWKELKSNEGKLRCEQLKAKYPSNFCKGFHRTGLPCTSGTCEQGPCCDWAKLLEDPNQLKETIYTSMPGSLQPAKPHRAPRGVMID
jgi:hypothetical protein